MNTPPLETERLILRKYAKSDLNALYEIYRDETVNRFLPWFPLKAMDETRMGAVEKLLHIYQKYDMLMIEK